jgi:hypothetical protein
VRARLAVVPDQRSLWCTHLRRGLGTTYEQTECKNDAGLQCARVRALSAGVSARLWPLRRRSKAGLPSGRRGYGGIFTRSDSVGNVWNVASVQIRLRIRARALAKVGGGLRYQAVRRSGAMAGIWTRANSVTREKRPRGVGVMRATSRLTARFLLAVSPGCSCQSSKLPVIHLRES